MVSLVLPGSRLAGELAARLAAAELAGDDACAEWPGARNENGYGRVSRDGKVWLAHRLAWAAANGPIPPGTVIRHGCDNPPCVRLSHLEPGTQRDNCLDALRRGRLRGRFVTVGAAVDAEAVRLVAGGSSRRAAARELGIGPSTVRRALRRAA